MKVLKNSIPKHLKKYIVKQDYSSYTYIDQSCWKFIMKISVNFFTKNAHKVYLEGLEKTGITINKIPEIDLINKKLNNFGWSAVCVRGFIPPNAFMEFQSLKILPIAADMRSHHHLTYTPAPDIVHEAAGHAPIIADHDYSQYLIDYGEIASKAIMSSEDMALYYAIRDLSDIKEKESTTKEEIEYYESKLEDAYANITYLSESSILSRMNWWTVEYGLIGNIESPKIYGAGLLSSVGESENCLQNSIKKLPLNLDCINYNYDITEQQPQLFVTPTFIHLTKTLNKLSKKMSYKIGGEHGLKQAVKAKTICTIELDNMFQISGIVEKYILHKGNPIFVKTSGPTQLCYKNKEITNQGISFHKEGYSCPIGNIKKYNKPINKLDKVEQKELNIEINKTVNFEFVGSIKVRGDITKIYKKGGSIIVLTLKNCLIKHKNSILFDPSWGKFDLIAGNIINSVYGGPCDKVNFYKDANNIGKYKKYNKSSKIVFNKKLNNLHKELAEIKNVRKSLKLIENIYKKAIHNFPNEWLILYEILELTSKIKSAYWVEEIKINLKKLIKNNDDLGNAIKRGLDLI